MKARLFDARRNSQPQPTLEEKVAARTAELAEKSANSSIPSGSLPRRVRLYRPFGRESPRNQQPLAIIRATLNFADARREERKAAPPSGGSNGLLPTSLPSPGGELHLGIHPAQLLDSILAGLVSDPPWPLQRRLSAPDPTAMVIGEKTSPSGSPISSSTPCRSCPTAAAHHQQ
jgi:hypothetical protein